MRVFLIPGTIDVGRAVKPYNAALTAAALTYVAATAVALAQLLRLIAIFGNRRRND